MSAHVAASLSKMKAAGAHPAELAAMRRRLEQLEHPEAGRLPGDVLEPLGDLPRLEDLPEPDGARAREVLDRLGAHHRAALTLRYLDGLPVPEVARHLDRTVHATEALLVRARAAFRRIYEGEEGSR